MKIGKESRQYQIFIDEGRGLVDTFFKIIKGLTMDSTSEAAGEMQEYVKGIYQEIITDKESIREKSPGGGKAKKTEGSSVQDLVEELTPRELDIMNLISQGLSNK
ncbi:MAG: hypothetical protein Q7I94_03535, partial [Candidatus Contubernalis sp.]|nr:hypothetical protein [Candidatus Contubernalis sp.]